MTKACELETCGQPFEAKRTDARFCSASCRATASRSRRAAAEMAPTVHLLAETPAANGNESPATILEIQGKLGGIFNTLKDLSVARTHTDDVISGFWSRVEELEDQIDDLQVRMFAEKADPAPSVSEHQANADERLDRIEIQVRRLVGALRKQAARITDIDKAGGQAILLLAGVKTE